MATGVVKRFSEMNGFGFIIADDGGRDVYFKLKHALQNVYVGDAVMFDLEEFEDGGRQARNIALAD